MEFTHSVESSPQPGSASFSRFAAHLPLSTILPPVCVALVTFPQGSFFDAAVVVSVAVAVAVAADCCTRICQG